MKKTTILIIAVLMGICFVILIYLQMSYLGEVIDMRREQFTESVNRSINRVVHTLEFEETRRGLINDAKQYLTDEKKMSADDTIAAVYNTAKPEKSHLCPSIDNDSTLSGPLLQTMPGMQAPKFPQSISHQGLVPTFGTTKEIQDIIKKRYIYQEKKLNDVILALLSEAGEKPINERLDFRSLDGRLKYEFESNGIKLPYHFQILTRDGHEIYRCSDYDAKGKNHVFTRILFPNDPPENMTVIKLHFPDMDRYILDSIRFIIPAIIFTLILLITYIFTIVVVLKQRKYVEMKNDFINNMTHEFKTISLAEQMLADPAVAKSGKMFEQLSGVINDETKRLRFQVEKVLQISLFDRNKAKYNKREINANNLIADVAHTYTIKVKNSHHRPLRKRRNHLCRRNALYERCVQPARQRLEIPPQRRRTETQHINPKRRLAHNNLRNRQRNRNTPRRPSQNIRTILPCSYRQPPRRKRLRPRTGLRKIYHRHTRRQHTRRKRVGTRNEIHNIITNNQKTELKWKNK